MARSTFTTTVRSHVATELRPWIQELSRVADCPVSAYPNAGLPNELGEYDDSPDNMSRVIGEFARSETGSNMMTVTCASPETFEQAVKFPEAHDLVRVRMGGWSDFFIAMFPAHQQHLMRRPLFEAPGEQS